MPRPSKTLIGAREALLDLKPGATPAEVRNRIATLCRANEYDPVAELLSLLRDGYRVYDGSVDEDGDRNFVLVSLDAKDAISIHKEILSYIAPKLKATSIEKTIKQSVNVTVTRFGGGDTTEVTDAKIIEEVIDAGPHPSREKEEENGTRESPTGSPGAGDESRDEVQENDG